MFCSYFKKHFIFQAIIAVIASIIIYQVCLTYYTDESDYPGEGVPVILWWTSFGTDGKFQQCGNYKCYFTSNRTFQYHQNTRSILFYGSDFRINDLPSWKSERVSWGLMHEESPRNNPILVHREALNLFNYSSTFSRFSDIPLTLVDLPETAKLMDKRYFVSTKKKKNLMLTKNYAPLLYIQSDCDTASDRDSYVFELMRYIRIDSYGDCLNNAEFNDRLKENYLETLNSEEFLSLVANYKFTIAFENAICQDYITEKLWRPLIVGSVPVYYGSPSFKDWLPNNKSAISILDFKGPKELADFLHNILINDTEYDTYLSHKLIDNYEIDNRKLKEALEKKQQSDVYHFGNYVEQFECFVCKESYKTKNREVKIVDKKHYDCPMPVCPLTRKVNKKNWWPRQWITEKCAAKVLVHYLSNNLTIDTESFEKSKMDLYEKNQCEVN